MDVKEASSQIEELSFDEVDAVSAGGGRGQAAGVVIVVAGGVVAVAGAPFIAAGIVLTGIAVVLISSGGDKPRRDGTSPRPL